MAYDGVNGFLYDEQSTSYLGDRFDEPLKTYYGSR